MSEWKEINLEDFWHFNPKVETQKNIEYSFIEMPDLIPGEKEVYPKRKRKPNGLTKFQNGDTLFAKITPCLENGKICQAKGLENNVGVGSTEFFVFRGKDNISDNDFVYYLLKWYPITKHAISCMSGSAGHQRVPSDVFKNFSLRLPVLSEQQQIAKTLTSLDSKISRLRQQNQTLEELAQTLFKRWFVDFEFPNENGQPYKSSGGKMIDSELGEIPEGWRVGRLSEIIINHDNKRVPLSSNERLSRKGNYPYHGATSIMDYVDDYLFDGRFVLLGEDGSVIDRDGFPILQFVDGKFWVNNHAHVLEGKDVFSTNFIYLLLRRTNISNIVTGAVQLKINQGNLNGISIIIGLDEILQKFNVIINTLFNQFFLNKNEIESFTQLRDKLLPKLMSGEIEIKL